MGMLFDSVGTRALKKELHKQFNPGHIGTPARLYANDFRSALPLADISEKMGIPDNTPSGSESQLKLRWQAFLARYVTGKQVEQDIKDKIADCLTSPYKPMNFHAQEDNSGVQTRVITWDEADTTGSTVGSVYGHMLMITPILPGAPVSKAVADRAVKSFLRKLAAEKRSRTKKGKGKRNSK